MGSSPGPRNLHEHGGVRRATSVSSAPIAEALAMQQTYANLPEPLRARLSESIEQLERLARRMEALLAEVTRRTPPRS